MLSSPRSRLSRSGVAPDAPPALPISSRLRLRANHATDQRARKRARARHTYTHTESERKREKKGGGASRRIREWRSGQLQKRQARLTAVAPLAAPAAAAEPAAARWRRPFCSSAHTASALSVARRHGHSLAAGAAAPLRVARSPAPQAACHLDLLSLAARPTHDSAGGWVSSDDSRGGRTIGHETIATVRGAVDGSTRWWWCGHWQEFLARRVLTPACSRWCSEGSDYGCTTH